MSTQKTAEDLINDLNQETENQGLNNTTVDSPSDVTGDHQSQDDQHFEPLTEEQKKQLTQQPEPEYSPVKAKSAAERYVSMFNGVMKVFFPWLYKQTILEKDDLKKVQEFQKQHKGKTDKEIDDVITSNDEMWPVVNRFDRYVAAVKEIPLDEEEQKMLAEPLADVLHQYRSLRLSPGWMLIIALCIVMFPRIMKMMPETPKPAK